mmetsp:Transcript_2873/g.7890  ORF Transcript_2873/g.7890 Transcript_2873/m.7890 type:complete len:101 (-) Transcript_2873:611-913(-)
MAPDIILGSDLTYNASAWRALLDTMRALSAPHTRVLYVSAAHPAFLAELRMFRTLAEASGFEWSDLDIKRKLANTADASRMLHLGELRAVELRLKPETLR